MTTLKDYKEEVMKYFEAVMPKSSSETISYPQFCNIRDFILVSLTAAEQAGEERMKKPLREALRMLEDEIPFTSEEVVMRIKEALK